MVDGGDRWGLWRAILHAITGAFVVLAFEDALDLFFEDERVVVRISAIFILVKLECQDLSRDSGASVSADAESQSVHGGWLSGKIPY